MSEYLTPAHVGYVISFPLGIESILLEGKAFNLRVAHAPMNSMGQLGVCRRNFDGTVSAPKPGSHARVDRDNPTVLDSRKLGYFRYNHTGQDNAMSSSGDADLSRLVASMSHYPPVTENLGLDDLFPTVSHRRVDQQEVQLSLPGDPFGTIRFPNAAQLFEVNLECTFEGGTKPNDYLLSFDLTDAAGANIELGRTNTGLPGSPREDVGYYRYLKVSGGRNIIRESVFLAENVRASAMRLTKWQNQAPVKIHNVSLKILK